MDVESVARTQVILQAMNLPTTIPDGVTVEQMLELMQVDKKVQAGKIRLILMKGIGQALVVDDYRAEILQQTLKNGF
jgi:3-dehydroquinate synthase